MMYTKFLLSLIIQGILSNTTPIPSMTNVSAYMKVLDTLVETWMEDIAKHIPTGLTSVA